MKLRVCLPIPDVTKSYLYEHEQLLKGYAKAILTVLHPSKAKKRKYQPSPRESYDDEHGRFLYYEYIIKTKKPDKTVWLKP